MINYEAKARELEELAGAAKLELAGLGQVGGGNTVPTEHIRQLFKLGLDGNSRGIALARRQAATYRLLAQAEEALRRAESYISCPHGNYGHLCNSEDDARVVTEALTAITAFRDAATSGASHD